MNNVISNEPRKSFKERYLKGKLKDFLILAALALALIFAAWKIFQGDDSSASATVGGASETEAKIIRLLEQIDGVGSANVVICETEEEIKSVVVVCEGADDLRVVMNVREAVSAALGTEQNLIKIYLKKE